MKKTYHIHINGIVQGVGFRPFVYVVAQQLSIVGMLRNDTNGVNVWFNATKNIADSFFSILTTQFPPKAKILSAAMEEIEDRMFEGFFIDTTQTSINSIDTLLSPDYVMCEDCRQELYDISNRRYRYPFITCTQCGPRFSIIKKLPYERYYTAMHNFLMCDMCQKEYDEILDKRYFSQTNSCLQCGIIMTLYSEKDKPLLVDVESILTYCKESFEKGKIIAIKGVGGYLLMCDANNTYAIESLRQRKQRPHKPFAVLYPNIEKIVEDFEISCQEQLLLESAGVPILLLYPKPHISKVLSISMIAPRLNKIGIMLPSNALLDLLVHDFGKPLIATSANLSGCPIIHNEEDGLEYLLSIADVIVTNNRAIIVPQDDSVLSFPKEEKKPVFIRRSRGFAPIYNNELFISEKCILSFGALLKSTFALSVHKHIFVSQYLGGGENYEFQETYKKSLFHFLELYKAKPQCMIADIHPNYFTHQLAKEMSQERGVEYITVQHHKAHFVAVLAENKLLDITEKVLGFIWDGTGLGTDGNIWGSECFIFEKKTMKRVSHFQYFTHIAGEKFALQPRLSLLSILADQAYVANHVIKKFTSQELFIYKKLIGEKKIKNSSAGRFIDAVACVLDLCNSITYEGEAAMYLQVEAEKYFYKHGYSMTEGYGDFNDSKNIDIQIILKQIIDDKNHHVDIGFIAAKFHYSLVCIIKNIAQKQGVKKLCFSGGVFQNTLLVSLLKYHLSQNFQLYFHHQLSPNDENISLGQLFYVDRGIDQ